MHMLQRVRCYGIYSEKQKDYWRPCTLGPVTPCDRRSKQDYLISAAGVAAEKVVYGVSYQSEGDAADRKDFDCPNAPSFEETVSHAYKILLGKETKLRLVISALEAK